MVSALTPDSWGWIDSGMNQLGCENVGLNDQIIKSTNLFKELLELFISDRVLNGNV